MVLSRRCSLGEKNLDKVHDSIVIQAVDPGVSKETVSAVDRMGGFGQRVTGQHWQTLEASVTFGIDLPKSAIEERREVFEAVKKWALRKGWLRMSEMPERRMYVDKVILPGSGDLREWTNSYTIGFRAYGVPFWQDENVQSAKSAVTSGGRVTVNVAGNTTSTLDVTFENRSGKTIDNFWVQAEGRRITLSGLNLGGSGTLSITHGTDGLMKIRIGSTSVYSKYTGADDLYVNPGDTPVDFDADRAGILTVTSCGRWI